MGTFNYFTNLQTKQKTLNYVLQKGEKVSKDYLDQLRVAKLPILPYTTMQGNIITFNVDNYISLSQQLKLSVISNKQALTYLTEIFQAFQVCNQNKIDGGLIIPDLEFVFISNEDVLHLTVIPSLNAPILQTLNRLFYSFALVWQPENATGNDLRNELMSISSEDSVQSLLNIQSFITQSKIKLELVTPKYKAPTLQDFQESPIQPVKEIIKEDTVVEQLEPISDDFGIPLTLSDETTLLTGVTLDSNITLRLYSDNPQFNFPNLQSREYVIGSSVKADIRISHKTVSRFHAILKIENGRAFIKDTSSTNGTFIDNIPVPPSGQFYEVSNTAYLRFADIDFHIVKE